MRIAFLTPEFPTQVDGHGGLASYLGRVTTALVQRGHQVEVFVLAPEQAQIDFHGVLVHQVKAGASQREGFTTWLEQRSIPTFSLLRRRYQNALALDQALRRRAGKVPFDVVQISNLGGLSLWVTRQPVAPVVMRISSYAPLWTRANCWPLTLERRVADWWEMQAIRACPWRYAPSRRIAAAVTGALDVTVSVLEPPFHLQHGAGDRRLLSQIAPWRPYLLHFGTLGPMKGSDIVVQAVLPLLETVPDLHLLLAGKPAAAEGQALLELAEAYPERIRYLGPLPPAQLYSIIRAARLVVLPSRIDNLPNSCLEAMALGRVVIGTAGASFGQLITEGESGFLVEIANSQALAQAIAVAWNLPEARLHAMGDAAKARMHRLRPEVTMPRLETYYRRVGETSAATRSCATHPSA